MRLTFLFAMTGGRKVRRGRGARFLSPGGEHGPIQGQARGAGRQSGTQQYGEDVARGQY